MASSTNCKLPPAVIGVGASALWRDAVIEYIHFNTPLSASQILTSVRWITPDVHGYSKEHIDGVLHAMQFVTEENSCSIIVCTNAEMLLPAAANRLLKSMEEPNPGWHVILCVENERLLPSTLRSRCIVYHLPGTQNIVAQKSLPMFVTCLFECTNITVAMAQFQLLREHCAGSAARTALYLDVLLLHWKKKREGADSLQIQKADAVIHVICTAYRQLPMPGGEMLFWRLLLLRMYKSWNDGLEKRVS